MHVHDNSSSETLRKTKQHNTTHSRQPFSKENELSRVGFEPTALCILDRCSYIPTELPITLQHLIQEELHSARLAELDSITGERDDARKRFEELRKQRLDQFMTGFSTITYKLKEMYQVCLLSGQLYST